MTPEALVEHYRGLAHAQYAGRKVVLLGAPLAAYSEVLLKSLMEGGASGVVIAARGLGTGPIPAEELAERIILDAGLASSVMEEIRATERMMADPPDELIEALDRWDPGGEAVVIGDGFSSVPTVAGRVMLGARPPEFVALEDKVAVDTVWDEAGVMRAPSSVVKRDVDAVLEAFARHDHGDGVVLAADATRGWHGGAAGVRWARARADVQPLLDQWLDVAEQVRVMPFLEGVACSIHGIVFPTGTAVFRPCEMLVFRRQDSPEFVYSGSATLWDPSATDRSDMRGVARRTGEALRERVDYRGGFTIDGVLAADGFRPTELNARLGAAFGQVGGALAGMSWGSLQRGLIDRREFDHPVEELERVVTEAADAHRSVRAGSFGAGRRMEETEEAVLLADGEGYRVVEESAAAVGTIMVGPNPQGYFARLGFEEGHLPVGDPAAPTVATALGAVDRHWRLGIGALIPARAVR